MKSWNRVPLRRVSRAHLASGAIAFIALLAGRSARAQSVLTPDLASAPGQWTLFNRSVEVKEEAGRRFLRFDERPGMGLAWIPGIDFADGVLEFDVRGRDLQQKSFVGVAFHAADDSTWEAIWLRPFNFKGIDSVHHLHAVQYAAYPAYTWKRLREEHPGSYEGAARPEPKGDAWVHVRIQVRSREVAVFLDGAARPTLQVPELDNRNHGQVALWVGDDSNGDFANLRITPDAR